MLKCKKSEKDDKSESSEELDSNCRLKIIEADEDEEN